jgi:hypothetical protein
MSNLRVRHAGWLSLLLVVGACAKGSDLHIIPGSSTVEIGTTRQFRATDASGAIVAVDWSAQSGSIDPSGLFTAPSIAQIAPTNGSASAAFKAWA